MRRISWAAGVAAVLVCAGGCGAQQGSGNAEQPLDPVPVSATEPALPLDSYMPSPDEQARSDRAQAVLERACLARFGLRWDGPGESALDIGRRMAASRQAERFGVVDPEQASRYGYQVPSWSTHNPRVGAILAARHVDVPPDVEKVLYGMTPEFGGERVPKDGCRAEAAGRLGRGAPEADRNLPARLAVQAVASTAEDPRLKPVLRAWKSCMERAGHDYASPKAASQDPLWKHHQAPSKTELTVAATDIRCQHEARYLPTLVTVTAQHQRRLMGPHTAELDRLQDQQEIRAENVTEALSTKPSHSTPAEGTWDGSG
ncbi:hypothetical protein ACIF70_32500 [Actinacidiphila glaucinigra]|uniref:hypothetical protein n=1 Tax=Actinacidiphila glaucinigra TaxID=235986 RepID=UPI0037C86063